MAGKGAVRRARTAPGQMDLFAVEQASGARADPRPKAATKAPERTSRKVKVNPKQSSKRAALETIGVLMPTRDAAHKLGIGVSTLEKMRLQRRGPPFVRLGKNIVRYRLADLEAWIAAQTNSVKR